MAPPHTSRQIPTPLTTCGDVHSPLCFLGCGQPPNDPPTPWIRGGPETPGGHDARHLRPPAQTGWTRKYAFATGLFYLVRFAASIPAAFYFLTPVLSDPNYIVGAGADTQVVIGCLLDTVNALAGIATAVAFYPVARRLNESLAIGFVTTRMFEAVVIMIGVISLLAVVMLRQDGVASTGVDQASLLTTGHALVAIRDYTFQFGPNVAAALNALMIGTILFRSRLVPRIIPAMGLLAVLPLLLATVATILGVVEQGSVWFAAGGALIFVWELSLGIYLVVKGFKPSPLTAVEPPAGA